MASADAVDVWNIIAPMTLTTAKSSLRRRIQIATLRTSGSSVAIGLKNSETSSGENCRSAAGAATDVTNQREASAVRVSATSSCSATRISGGLAARGAKR